MEHSGNTDSMLIAALQAKIASLSLEKQQLAQIIKVTHHKNCDFQKQLTDDMIFQLNQFSV